jgi:reactive chlorine resistance protein C
MNSSVRERFRTPLAGVCKGPKVFTAMAKLDRVAVTILRSGLILVLIWIGGLKFTDYEADSIVPLVSNSPIMGFVYRHPTPDYRQYMNKEGQLVPAHRQWQIENRTYVISHALGIVIVLLGIMIALHKPLPQVAAIGSALLIGMSCVTLSFLITTPEAWVPAAGDSAHGFPYLSGVGRLIIKDSIMIGGAFVTMADSAKAYLLKRAGQKRGIHSEVLSQ